MTLSIQSVQHFWKTDLNRDGRISDKELVGKIMNDTSFYLGKVIGHKLARKIIQVLAKDAAPKIIKTLYKSKNDTIEVWEFMERVNRERLQEGKKEFYDQKEISAWKKAYEKLDDAKKNLEKKGICVHSRYLLEALYDKQKGLKNTFIDHANQAAPQLDLPQEKSCHLFKRFSFYNEEGNLNGSTEYLSAALKALRDRGLKSELISSTVFAIAGNARKRTASTLRFIPRVVKAFSKRFTSDQIAGILVFVSKAAVWRTYMAYEVLPGTLKKFERQKVSPDKVFALLKTVVRKTKYEGTAEVIKTLPEAYARLRHEKYGFDEKIHILGEVAEGAGRNFAVASKVLPKALRELITEGYDLRNSVYMLKMVARNSGSNVGRAYRALPGLIKLLKSKGYDLNKSMIIVRTLSFHARNKSSEVFGKLKNIIKPNMKTRDILEKLKAK